MFSDAQIIVNANLRQTEVLLAGDIPVLSPIERGSKSLSSGKNPSLKRLKPKRTSLTLVDERIFKNEIESEMDCGWCRRVEAGKNIAGKNRERERLIACAIEIASSQLVVFIE